MSVRVTRDNVRQLIDSGAIRIGTKLVIDGDGCKVSGFYLDDRDQPLGIEGHPHGCYWPDLSGTACDVRLATPPTTDDGFQTIRDAVTQAVATATPAQVLAAASALGLKVEQTTTYRIV